MTDCIGESISCGAKACSMDHGRKVSDAGMTFIRCPVCQVLRIPPENVLHHSVKPDPGGSSVVMGLLFRMRMTWLGMLLPQIRKKSATVLDAGCGDGQFLEFLSNRGYRNIIGVEPDEVRLANALARGIRAFRSLSEAKEVSAIEEFTVINLWQVLEHIPQPAVLLREYASSLATGGLMIISVPNQDSLQTKLFGFYSAYPDYGRHIWYHDRSFVSWLREELPECEISVLSDLNFEYEIFAWIDSTVSFVLKRQNVVHKIMKKGEGGALVRLVVGAVSVLLLPFSVVASCASLAAGRGSTLTFIAIRR